MGESGELLRIGLFSPEDKSLKIKREQSAGSPEATNEDQRETRAPSGSSAMKESVLSALQSKIWPKRLLEEVVEVEVEDPNSGLPAAADSPILAGNLRKRRLPSEEEAAADRRSSEIVEGESVWKRHRPGAVLSPLRGELKRTAVKRPRTPPEIQLEFGVKRSRKEVRKADISRQAVKREPQASPDIVAVPRGGESGGAVCEEEEPEAGLVDPSRPPRPRLPPLLPDGSGFLSFKARLPIYQLKSPREVSPPTGNEASGDARGLLEMEEELRQKRLRRMIRGIGSETSPKSILKKPTERFPTFSAGSGSTVSEWAVSASAGLSAAPLTATTTQQQVASSTPLSSASAPTTTSLSSTLSSSFDSKQTTAAGVIQFGTGTTSTVAPAPSFNVPGLPVLPNMFNPGAAPARRPTTGISTRRRRR